MSTITIIGGCGRVGLPLAAYLAQREQQVQIADIDVQAVQSLNQKKAPFFEPDLDSLIQKADFKIITSDPSQLAYSDFVIVSLPTPVDFKYETQMITETLAQYKNCIDSRTQVIIRSTLSLQSFEPIAKYVNLVLKNDQVSYCPERMASGFALSDLVQIPQIVASENFESEQRVVGFFNQMNIKTIVATVKEALLLKLFSNSWRFTEFALANQFYMLSETEGVNFPELLKKMKSDYPRASHFPSAGLVGGPCLLKDQNKMIDYFDSDLLKAAKDINNRLPDFLVSQLIRKMGPLKDKKIGLLGKSFKANSDDLRGSRSLQLIERLKAELALPEALEPEEILSVEDLAFHFDGLIVNIPHPKYSSDKLKIPMIDCWGTIS